MRHSARQGSARRGCHLCGQVDEFGVFAPEESIILKGVYHRQGRSPGVDGEPRRMPTRSVCLRELQLGGINGRSQKLTPPSMSRACMTFPLTVPET